MREILNEKETDYYTKLKKFLPFDGAKLLVLLKTPRFGEEVDNGACMDLDLTRFSIITFKKESNHSNMLFSWGMCMESFGFGREFDFMNFEINSDSETNVDDLIEELGDRDGFEVIWDLRKDI